MNSELFNKKALELVDYLLRIFPQHDKLITARAGLKLAASTSPDLPVSKFKYSLLRTLPDSNQTLIDAIRDVKNIHEIDVRTSPLLRMIPFVETVDVTSVNRAQRMRLWTSLLELVALAGYDLENKKPENPHDLRAQKFNVQYRDLLANLEVAFPSETKVTENFDLALAANNDSPSSVALLRFREVVMPIFSSIEFLRNPDALVTQLKNVLKQLPFIRDLPLDEYWDVSIEQNEFNRDEILKKFMDAMMMVTGINEMNSGLTDMLRNGIMSNIAGASGEMDIMAIAQNIVGELQANSGTQKLVDDIRQNKNKLDTEMLASFAAVAMPPELRAAMQAGMGNMQGPFEQKK